MQRELDCIPCQFLIFGTQTVWIISSREQCGLLYVGVPSLPLHSYHPTCSGCQEPVGSLGEYHLGGSLKQELKRGAYRDRKTAGPTAVCLEDSSLASCLGNFSSPGVSFFPDLCGSGTLLISLSLTQASGNPRPGDNAALSHNTGF